MSTLDIYQKLYAGDYMFDGLKCAKEAIEILKGIEYRSLLDVGCGRGHFAEYIRTTGKVAAGVDPVMTGDMLPHLCFADKCIDVVTCLDVLEHIAEDQATLCVRELCRIASIAVIFTICTDSDIHQIDGNLIELHINRSPPGWWQNICAKFGDFVTTYHPCQEKSRHLFCMTRIQ